MNNCNNYFRYAGCAPAANRGESSRLRGRYTVSGRASSRSLAGQRQPPNCILLPGHTQSPPPSSTSASSFQSSCCACRLRPQPSPRHVVQKRLSDVQVEWRARAQPRVRSRRRCERSRLVCCIYGPSKETVVARVVIAPWLWGTAVVGPGVVAALMLAAVTLLPKASC